MPFYLDEIDGKELVIHRFYDPRIGRELVTIQAGELYASSGQELIYTVLGSCVSVCLYDETMQVGGMNHFNLSRRTPSTTQSFTDPRRFGNTATALLLEAVLAKGALPPNLKAKVFGGAAVARVSSEPGALGRENVEVARRFLEENGIELVSNHVGGTAARRILFHVKSGMVLVSTSEERGTDSDPVPSSLVLAWTKQKTT